MGKVDLLNFMFEEDGGTDSPKKDGVSKDSGSGKKVIKSSSDPTSAYLGPKLWNNPITLEDLMDEDGGSGEAVALSDIFYENSEGSPMVTSSPEPASPTMSEPADVKPALRPSIIVPPTKRDNVKIEPNLPSGANEFLYVESRRARMDREKEERKRKLEVQLSLPPRTLHWPPCLAWISIPRPGPLTWRSSDLSPSSRRGRRTPFPRRQRMRSIGRSV